jgi:polysaccharide export outer membrane protein
MASRTLRASFRMKILTKALATFVFASGLPLFAAAGQQLEYMLGSQDVLSITVWGQGGLSERFTVDADGGFTFPMLGRVSVTGLTVRQVQDQLTHRLADGYFTNPQVTVVVEVYESQRVFVVGEVHRPGAYPLRRQITLVEALVLAGSTTTQAGNVALIQRRADEETHQGQTVISDNKTEIRVDLTGLKSGVLSNNPVLRDGDTVVVPPALSAAPVYVFGEVGRPGEYTIREGATVRHVLSLAGGVARRGSTGRVKILRMVDGREREIKVELDDRVEPGDTVVVPERFF